MADAQKTIDLIFNGVDKTGAATLSALNNAKSFTGSLQNVTQPIADFTAGALKFEAGLLAAGAAMTVFAVKTAGDFDTAFRELSTIIDASDEDLAGFKISIDEYARGSTQSMEQIMGALSGAVGSGVEWSKSLGLISVAEKLAVATRSDLDSTTKVLVSTLKSYGLEIKDAGDLSDLFFSIIDKGDIKMADLSASFAKIAPVAKISGVSLEEVGAAIATLTASGIKPAEAIEYLRGAISNIISPSGQAKDLAAELGINFGAAGLKADGLAGLLKKVSEATGGSADKMKILFGDIGGFVAVASLAGPQAATFAQNLIDMADRAGKSGAAFEIMKLSIENSSKIIGSSFDYLLRQVGTPLLDEFGGIANAIAGIFTALGVSVKEGGLKDLVSYIDSLFDDLQKTIETVATNLPAALANADLSGFKNGIDAVVGAFARLFGNIDITTVDGLTRAIELAGAAFLGLSKFTAGVIESFKPLFDKLVEIGGQLGGLDSNFFEMAGNIGGVVTQFNLLLGGITNLLPWLETLVGLLVAKQGMSLLGGVSALVTTLPAMTGALSAAGAVMAAYFASDKVIELVKALNEWRQANDHLADSQKQSVDINERAGLSLQRFAETTGMVVSSVDEASKLIDAGTVVWSDAANGWVKAGDAMAGVNKQARDGAGSFDESNQAMIEAFAASEKAATGITGLGKAQESANSYALQTVPIYDKLTGAITGYEQQLVKTEGGTVKLASAADKAGGGLAKIAEETKKAEESTRRWNEEIAKMAFEEKLAMIESQTKITTAQIEADSKISVAAIESIGNTINSTGELLQTLFGSVKDFAGMDWSSIRLIEKQIDMENKIRKEAHDKTMERMNVEIEKMKEQTKAMAKGEGLIKIDGAGLKPHLEAFMWEILRAIQVKVNKDGLKMLLGA